LTTSYSFFKVAGLCADESACGYYRVINPLNTLKKLGAKTTTFVVVSPGDLRDYDIIIAQRQVSPTIYRMLGGMIEAGKTVIFESDDLMDKIDPASPAFRYYHTGSADLNVMKNIMSRSHGITVTTPELAADALQYSKNVRVIPNYIDFSERDWKVKKHTKNKDAITLIWSGSKSHLPDMPILGAALERIMRKYPKVRYAHYASEDLLKYLVNTWDIPQDRVEVVPMRSFADYPSGLLSGDIGLAPIKNIAFNRAKSPLKVLEFSSCGIPYVASRVAPYQRFNQTSPGGRTSDTTSEWVDRLSEYIDDPKRIREEGQALADYAREEWDIEKHIDEYISAWTDIGFAAKMGDVGAALAVNLEPKRNDKCPCGSGKKYKKCCIPSYGGG
jgi:glycosyltransferase involved in cell wall biosynthesis